MNRLGASSLRCAIVFATVFVVLQAPSPSRAEPFENAMQKLRRSMDEVRALGSAFMAYSIDFNRYPEPGTADLKVGPHSFCAVAKLAEALGPYHPKAPDKDPYSNAYLYWTSSDGQHFAVLCLGSSGHLRHAADVEAIISGLTTSKHAFPHTDVKCYQDPIVFADGQFITYPRGDVEDCP